MCSFNPTADFIIVTDNQDIVFKKPKNLQIVHKTLDDLKKSSKEKLAFIVSIDYPYKLNDFKPAYGFLFPEIVKGYDFWGQGDLDIICGNISDLMDDQMLEKYDFISLRHDYATGCFSLYRNNEILNTLFMQSKDYRQVLSNSKHYCYDECSFAWNELAAFKHLKPTGCFLSSLESL